MNVLTSFLRDRVTTGFSLAFQGDNNEDTSLSSCFSSFLFCFIISRFCSHKPLFPSLHSFHSTMALPLARIEAGNTFGGSSHAFLRPCAPLGARLCCSACCALTNQRRVWCLWLCAGVTNSGHPDGHHQRAQPSGRCRLLPARGDHQVLRNARQAHLKGTAPSHRFPAWPRPNAPLPRVCGATHTHTHTHTHGTHARSSRLLSMSRHFEHNQVLKHPEIEDYSLSVVELDEKEYLNMRLVPTTTA